MGTPESSGKVTPAISSPNANRRYKHKAMGNPASKKLQEPQFASEPPKLNDKHGINQTTRSTKSSDSSYVRARREDSVKHMTTSKAGGYSQQILMAPPKEKKLSVSNTPRQLLPSDIENIERQTRGQRENEKWYHWRQNRITASLAHQISHSKFANEKTQNIPQSYLKAVLGTGPKVQTAAMIWGSRNEKKAVLIYQTLASRDKGREVQVEECGLFIHPTKTWLAASPDGIVKDKFTQEKMCLLEVKCPYKHKEHTMQEACRDKYFCLESSGDTYILKPNHAYYTQVQCQLAVTGMSHADFVVHTNKETAIIPVKFDLEFWKMTEPKLEKFYMEAVLPHVKNGPSTKEPEKKEVYAPEE